ncbi:MAG TPA: hypothetical protein VHB77_10785 [Planctomycetaceae bacterium]|nr:hypothetical protein [Planctomycetaceae bacterium]
MARSCVQLIVACVLMVLLVSGHAVAQKPDEGKESLEGFWSGSWGGGQRDGVVFQPVLAEMVIRGDRIETAGVRNAGRLSGTVTIDARQRRLRMTPARERDDGPEPKTLEFSYELQKDTLTLTDSEKVPMSFRRIRIQPNPLANVQVELVAAEGINDSGDLLLVEYSELHVGTSVSWHPHHRALKTRQAAVFVVADDDVKQISVNEARRFIREPAPAAVVYRPENREPGFRSGQLWKELVPSMPESEAVRRTFARALRPGTLVFVLSATENVPVA